MCKFYYNGQWVDETQLRQIFDDNNGFKQSKASPKTIAKMKDWLDRSGISLQALDTSRYSGNNGVAFLLSKIIQIAEGKEDVAITEEGMHFLAAMVKVGNPGLYNRMANKIINYDIYSQTKKLYEDDPQYKDENGNPNILKIKEEAIGKLLAEYYLQKEQPQDSIKIGQQKAWWQAILDWIKELLNITTNPFKEALNQMEKGGEVISGEQIRSLADEIVESTSEKSYFKGALQGMLDSGQYKNIVEEVASQLADTNSYELMASTLNHNEALISKVLDAYGQFNQKGDWDNKKKFDDKIKQFDLQKKMDTNDPDDENNNSYYTVKVEGKEHKADRTTDYAKRVNKRAGKDDYLAKASKEEKKQWARLALQGTTGHYNMEQLVKAALNPDGTIKDRGDIITPQPVGINPTIHSKMVEYLYGTKDKLGFLYQFAPGARVLVEQQIYDEKQSPTVDGKKLYGRAGTMDLYVELPNGDVKVYDWKFMKNLLAKPDQNFLKQAQHAVQLGDYKRILESYGIKGKIEAFTIPIHAEYQDFKKPDGEIYPVLTRITLGNHVFTDETRTPLLPVIPEDQSTGNKKIDDLVKKLKAKYQKIWKAPTTDELRNAKSEELNSLSVAIRNVQVALNFGPLTVEARNFKEGLNSVSDKYAKIDVDTLTLGEKKSAISELMSILNSADYYGELDKVFISEYGDDNLDADHKKILAQLRQASSAIDSAKDELIETLNKIVDSVARTEGFEGFLNAEKEATGIINSMTEAASVNHKAQKLLTKIILRERSRDALAVEKESERFESLYLDAARSNSNVFALIADEEEHQLIQKVKSDFYKDLDEAKKNKDKATILKNIDLAEYKKLSTERINSEIERIDKRIYSTDDAENDRIRGYQKTNARKALDITRADFNGYEDKVFGYLISKVLNTEAHYTDAYKAMAANPAALALYNYLFDMNKRARMAGYLPKTIKSKSGKYKSSALFLPFITKTMLQRLASSNNKLSTLKDSLIDQYTANPNEKLQYGKRDPETGEQDRSIPVYFTTDNKTTTDYSKDLVKIVPRYIQALQEYETSKDLEDLFLGILKTEQNKGHLEVNKATGNVYFEGGSPVIFPGNTKNAEIVRKIVDDTIYGQSQESDTFIDKMVGKLSKGTAEEKEEVSLSIKKIVQNSNMLTQQLAVGLKVLVAAPNFAGAFIQEGINNGRFSSRGEYKKNFFRIVASAFKGKEGNIDKALLHTLMPLNENIAKEATRRIARKESMLKFVSTWSFNEVMMSSNRLPDVAHELTNAKTWIDNTMIVDGKLTNIRQYVRDVEFAGKYKSIESGEKTAKATDKEFEARVKELKETKSLPKIAKFDSKGELDIPGFDMEKGNLAEYRVKIIEYGRYITGQMNRDNKADYRRNIIATSFMMFKNWIPKQVSLRALDIHYNSQLDEWEYGRTRLFFKTWQHLGLTKILKIRQLTNATHEGIAIMREMLEQKKQDYYKKTGQKLDITEEQFFDMVRRELKNEYKELQMILYLGAMVVAAKAAAPPDDEDDALKRNRYKTFAKLINKVSDELYFYWSPLSAQAITRGTVLPSLGILTKVTNIMQHTGTEIFGIDWANKEVFSPDIREKNQTVKYWLDIFPIASQFEHELLPIISPDAATALGIKVTTQSRPNE